MIRDSKPVAALIVCAFALAVSVTAVAQGRGGGGGAGASGAGSMSTQAPTQDQDRMRDRDQDRDQDRDRDQDQDRDRDRDQDRDRQQLHQQDRDEFRSRDIYGSELMTRRERREYRDQIRSMNDVGAWARYRAQHQQQMMSRARERGATLAPPFYGQNLMTDQERVRLRDRLQNAATEQERARIQQEHREQMQSRARENQIPLSELE